MDIRKNAEFSIDFLLRKTDDDTRRTLSPVCSEASLESTLCRSYPFEDENNILISRCSRHGRKEYFCGSKFMHTYTDDLNTRSGIVNSEAFPCLHTSFDCSSFRSPHFISRTSTDSVYRLQHQQLWLNHIGAHAISNPWFQENNDDDICLSLSGESVI